MIEIYTHEADEHGTACKHCGMHLGGVWEFGKKVGLIFSEHGRNHAYPIGENDTNLPCSEKPVLQNT